MGGVVAVVMEIIIYYVIIRVIIKAFRKKNTEQRRTPDATQVYRTPVQQTGQRVSGTTSGKSVSSAGQVSAKTEPVSTEKSTTDYLSEKARQDQIEHAREKREESARIEKKAGGLQAAGRLLPGDPIPAGQHCVICGYCAAENLIADGSRMRYSCYFCREPL